MGFLYTARFPSLPAGYNTQLRVAFQPIDGRISRIPNDNDGALAAAAQCWRNYYFLRVMKLRHVVYIPSKIEMKNRHHVAKNNIFWIFKIALPNVGVKLVQINNYT